MTLYDENGQLLEAEIVYSPWKINLYLGTHLTSTVEINATKEQLGPILERYEQDGYTVEIIQYQQTGDTL